VTECCDELTAFVRGARASGHVVAAYGAAAKGNTLLNTCGLTAKDIVCVADLSPHKQGRLLPGSHIPIVAPDRLKQIRPDYLLILPWNLETEIMSSMAYVGEWGCRFVTPIPRLRVHP
jgi:hypothetical protein